MKKVIYSLLILSLLLVGCGNSETQNAKPDDEKKQEQSKNDEKNNKATEKSDQNEMRDDSSNFYESIPAAPKNPSDVVNQLPGEFAGVPVNLDEVKPKVLEKIKEAPPLGDQPSEEDYDHYFNMLYSLISKDFPDPEEVLKKWEYALSGTPDASDERFKFKDQYNVEIILDSSGSMNNLVGNKTRMDLAKESINRFLSTVPEEANVSLRVYGHKGTSSDADKEKSCSKIEQVYDFKPYNEEEFTKSLESFRPSGWTPIEGALKESKKALDQFDPKTTTNLIYLVSDGIETCDGHPEEYAKTFADSPIKPIVNVIGFNVDGEAQKQLKAIAENTDGVYTTVTNADELNDEFDRAKEVLESWEKWKKNALQDVDAKETDAYFDILGYTNSFSFQIISQDNNIDRLITTLSLEDILTQEDSKELKKRAKETRKIIEEAEAQVEEDLKQASNTKLDELKKRINEKYNSNTN